MDSLKTLVSEIPELSGVYLMKDVQGEIIYVGKAVNLRKRVNSYFLKNRDPKTGILVQKIHDIETIITESEYEALLLENILIKKWNPRYNIRLKDDKSYPVIRITNEAFPRVFKTRRIIQDGSKYFGPFASAGLLGMYLDTIEKLIPVRKCKGPLKERKNPCLYYHIGRCSAPCAGHIIEDDYKKLIEQIETLLSEENTELLNWLKDKMTNAAAALDYEKAAEYRDSITAAESIINETSQRIIDYNDERRDYIAFASFGELYTFIVFKMRAGRLAERELYRTNYISSDDLALEQFIMRFYSEQEEIPSRIFLPIPIKTDLLSAFFKKEKETVVEFNYPEGGRDKSIIRMAMENASQDIAGQKRGIENLESVVALKETLNLPALPVVIEGFDIAQLAGKYPAASLVYFKNGVPVPRNYRYFSIKTLQGKIDDFAAVREAVARRYSRLLNEGHKMPDLVFVDGGRGQVNAAKGVLDALGLHTIPVAGLAEKNEEIYLSGRRDIIQLPEGDPALKLLQHVRDETHRFATKFNKNKRKQDNRFSLLQQVPGIGPARSEKLMEIYGSLRTIARQSPAEINSAIGLPLKTAEKLLAVLKEEGE